MSNSTIPLAHTPLFARTAREHGLLRDIVPTKTPLGQVVPVEKPSFPPECATYTPGDGRYTARFSDTTIPEFTVFRYVRGGWAEVTALTLEETYRYLAGDWNKRTAMGAWLPKNGPDAERLRDALDKRIDLSECEVFGWCTNHAVDGTACVEHGGHDELD